MGRRDVFVVTIGLLMVFATKAFGQDEPTRRPDDSDAARKPSSEEVQKLIDQLGSSSFNEREAASKRLDILGELAFV